jgi:4-amino-4-deoxy-L-arabinose transferase-like glycosyltransferase
MALAAVLAAVFYVYPVALPNALLDPDEGLHAAIAQEMVEGGDWLVPRLFGRPFLDKPAFYFWFEAGSLWLFGMREGAVRLPGLLFGLLGAVTTGLVGWRTLGPAVGWLSALLYGTLFLPLALAQAAAPDVALVPWINLAMLLLWESEWATPRRAAGFVAAAGLFMGLALLTKGLFGVALIIVAHGGFWLLSKRLSVWAILRGFAALMIGIAIGALWYVPMERACPGYLEYFFIDRHFLGFVSDTQHHGTADWWYYLPILLLGGLPWISYLPALLRDSWDRRGSTTAAAASPQRPVKLWLLVWLVGCTLLLSLASSKLVTYLWPVFPPLAVLAAEAWRRLFDGELVEPARRMMVSTLWFSCWTSPLLFPVAMLVVQFEMDLTLPTSAWVATIVAGFVTVLPMAALRHGEMRYALAGAMLATAAQFMLLMTFVLPHVAERTSARGLAEHFNRNGLPDRARLVDERVGSLIFYLDPDVRRSVRFGQVARVRSKDAAYEPVGTVLVVPQSRIAATRRRIDLHGLTYTLVDRYRVYDPLTGPAPRARAVGELK